MPNAKRSSVAIVVMVVIAIVAAACSDDSGTESSSESAEESSAESSTAAPTADIEPILFGAQGNHLEAYATEPVAPDTFVTQRVITGHDGVPAETSSPTGTDINAQICFFPDHPGWFIAGEDTNQPDPPPGWGIFQLDGTEVSELSARQIGKLTPTYQSSEDNQENYGCGFLSGERLVTTDVGNQAQGDGDGQLIVWFAPFDSRDVKYCKLDIGLATAQSILVGPDDTLYVASARGDVYKYVGPFPTGPDAAGGCAKLDVTGAPMADQVNKSTFIAKGQNGLDTPAGLAWAPDGGLYVSSVFTGVINQYDRVGAFVRNILKPAPDDTLSTTSYKTGTPLGIVSGPDGTIYYADINIVVEPGELPGPGRQTGSVRRIRIVNGEPQAPETIRQGLAFPDGLGVYPPVPPTGTSTN